MPEVTGTLKTPRLAAPPSSPVAGQMYYDTGTNTLLWFNGTAWVSASGGGGSSVANVKAITQTSHGLAVGNLVYLNGATYAKAQADTAAHAEVVGIVSAVADANNFTLLTDGYITGLSGLTAGTAYFLDPSTAGALTATEPIVANQISKPLLVADSTTSGYFFNYRGQVITIGSTSGVIGARVYNTANTSVPTGTTPTVLLFNTERFDTDNIHDTSTNTSRLTCRTPGKYVIVGHVMWEGATGGTYRDAQIRINGGTIIGFNRMPPPGSGGGDGFTVTAIWDMVAGDYVELLAQHDSGGNLNVWGQGTTPAFSSEFSMARLDALVGPPGPAGPAGAPGTGSAGSPVTTLPASPSDLQQAILVDNVTTPTYAWLLQWSATAAKWICLGGSMLSASAAASGTLANVGATWTDLPTPFSITVPRAGIYEVEFGVGELIGGQQIQVGVKFGSNAINPADSVYVDQATGVGTSGARRTVTPTVAASDIFKFQYRSQSGGNPGGWTHSYLWVSVRPRWVT